MAFKRLNTSKLDTLVELFSYENDYTVDHAPSRRLVSLGKRYAALRSVYVPRENVDNQNEQGVDMLEIAIRHETLLGTTAAVSINQSMYEVVGKLIPDYSQRTNTFLFGRLKTKLS